MGIIIALTILTVAGFFLAMSDDFEILGVLLVITGGLSLAIAMATLPLSRMITHSEIEQYKSVTTTIESARSRGETIENAAIQMKIADTNRWLASTQYWNSTVFDWWIPDDVEDMEPIK